MDTTRWGIVILCLCASTAGAEVGGLLDIGSPPIGMLCEPCPLAVDVSSGRGAGYVRLGVTDEGLVRVWESPQFHRLVGTDGYAVCSEEASGFALGGGNNPTGDPFTVGFGPPEVTYPPDPENPGAILLDFPLTITRSVEDGSLELVQHFSWRPHQQELVLTLTLTNTGTEPRHGVGLSRSLHPWPGLVWDGTYTPEGPAIERLPHVRMGEGEHSVWAWTEDILETPVISLSTPTALVPHESVVRSVSAWFDEGFGAGCGNTFKEHGLTTPFFWVGSLNFALGRLNPGQQRRVQVVYRRF